MGRSGSIFASRRARRLLCLSLAVLAVGSLVAPATGSGPGIPGFGPTGPQLVGKALPDGSLAVLWTPDDSQVFVSGTQVVSDGSLLYGGTLTIDVYNPQPVGYALPIEIEQFVPGTTVVLENSTIDNRTILYNATVPYRYDAVWDNATIQLLGRQVSEVSVTLSNSGAGRTLATVVSMEGVQWRFSHLTPNFLLPLPTTTGGVEILVAGEAVWSVILMGIATMAARVTQRRVPGISAWRWGPGVLSGVVFASGIIWFVADPLSFFQTVGGSSYLLYPSVIAFLWYMWFQRFFELGPPTLISQAILGNRVEFLFNEDYRVIAGPDGGDYLGRKTFGGWFWPLIGQPTRIDLRRTLSAPSAGKIAEGPAVSKEVVWDDGRVDRRLEKIRRTAERLDRLRGVRARSAPGAVPPGFPIRGMDVQQWFWIDSDRPFRVQWPRFRLWTEEPRHGAAGEILRDDAGQPVVRRRFRPHVDNPGASVPLSGRHWVDVLATAMGYRDAERLARDLELAEVALLQQEGRLHEEASRMTRERVALLVRRLRYRREAASAEESQKEAEEIIRRYVHRGKEPGPGGGNGAEASPKPA